MRGFKASHTLQRVELKMTRSEFNYKAFISYKHGSSTHFAADLESALKQYAKPLLSPPIKIFRDEKYIVPNIDLPRLITDALDDSEFLLLLASPEAARSPWVQDELRHWCAEPDRAKNLIILLLEGHIAVDSVTKQIDWQQTDALPHLLANHMSSVPYYLDFTQGDYQPGTGLRHPAFRHAVNAITARFRGIELNDMIGIEVRQHRRNLRLRNAAVAAIAVLGIAAAAASWVASDQRDEAVSRLLAAQALQPESRIDTALLTAVSSFDTAPTQEASNALRTLAFTFGDVEHVFASTEPLRAAAVDPDGKYLAVAGQRGTITVWELESSRFVFNGSFDNRAQAVGLAYLLNQGSFVALSRNGEVCTISIPNQSSECRSLDLDNALGLKVDLIGRLIVLHGIGRLSMVDINTLEKNTISLPGGGHDITVMSWDVSPDGNTVVIGTYDGALSSLSLTDGVSNSLRAAGSPIIRFIHFLPDGSKVALSDEGKRVGVLDLSTKQYEDLPCLFPVEIHRLEFLQGLIVGAAIDGSLHWCTSASADSLEQRRSVQKGNVVELLSIGKKEDRIMLVNEDGTAVIRNLSSSTPFTTLPSTGQPYSRLAFAGNNSLIAGADNGEVLHWNLAIRNKPTVIGKMSSMVRGLAVSQNETSLAFAGQGEFVTVKTIDDERSTLIPVADAPFEYVTSLDFSPKGDILAVGDSGGQLFLQNVQTGNRIEIIQSNQHPNTMCCLAYDKSGRWLISADNDGNLLWRDAETAIAQGGIVPLHDGIISQLTATNKNAETLSVGFDGRIIIQTVNETSPRCEVRHPDGSVIHAGAHAAKASVFATVSEQSLVVWSSETPCRLLFQFAVTKANGAAVAISDDGSLIAWSTWGGPISLLQIPETTQLSRELCGRVTGLHTSTRCQ
jgi:WD40 repeat protein